MGGIVNSSVSCDLANLWEREPSGLHYVKRLTLKKHLFIHPISCQNGFIIFLGKHILGKVQKKVQLFK